MRRKIRVFTAWCALLGIVLHAFVPLAGITARGVAPHAHAAHSHAGATHETHHHAQASHHAQGVHEAPAAPDTFCVGDCPCCLANLKAFLPARPAVFLRIPDLRDALPETPPAHLQLAEYIHDHPARAPPPRLSLSLSTRRA